MILIPAGAAVASAVSMAVLFGSVPAVSGEPVRDLRCRWNYTTHTVGMTATVVNETDAPQNYAYQVDYLTKAGKRVGSGTLIVSKVQPGQTASVTGLGDFVPGEVPDRCVIGLD